MAGAHIATLPYKVILQMLNHPLTDAGIEKFKKDYGENFFETTKPVLIIHNDTLN